MLYFKKKKKKKLTVKFKIGGSWGYLYNGLLRDRIFHVCKNKFYRLQIKNILRICILLKINKYSYVFSGFLRKRNTLSILP